MLSHRARQREGDANQTDRLYRWWLTAKPPAEEQANPIYDEVVRTVRWLRDRMDYRRRADLLHAQLYSDEPIAGFGLRSFSRFSSGERISINVVQSACDALQAKISKNKPKPTFLVSGGDYSLKRQAETLEKFSEGQLYESGFYEVRPSVILDACIYGTGVYKMYVQDARIKVERTYPFELLVSDAEARYGKPRAIYQRKYIDRAVLAEMYPTLADEIMAAKNSDQDLMDAVDYDEQCDQILVLEAWHLPSSPTSDDGRHVICVTSCTLLDEPWTKDHFPFAFVRRNKPQRGFWGIGVAQQGIGIQEELNYLSRAIQEAHGLVAVPRIFVEAGSKVNPREMNNGTGVFVHYTGTPPIISRGEAVAPELYQYQQWLITTFYKMTGVSEMGAQGAKPAGLDSAIALRTFDDIASERFVTFQAEDEDAVLEVAKQMIELAQEKVDGGYEVRIVDRSKSLHVIDVRDVDLTSEEYVMKVFPSSMLPSTPAGKLQWIQDVSKMGPGVISPDEILDLLDIPDTESMQKRKSGPRRVIERNIESMIRDGVYVSPEPTDNHSLAASMVTEAYANARLDGVPEAHRELLLQYLGATETFLNPKPATPPQPVPPPPGAPPLGAGPSPMPPVGGVPPANDNEPAPMPGAPMGPMQ